METLPIVYITQDTYELIISSDPCSSIDRTYFVLPLPPSGRGYAGLSLANVLRNAGIIVELSVQE